MAAKAQPRSGRHTRRRTRYDTPAWAEDYPDTAEGMDALQAGTEARRIPTDTDPDTIDDPDVRAAFVRRLEDEHAASQEGDASGEHPERTPARSPGPPPARSGRAKPSPAGGSRTSSPGIPTPTLRPPSRLSASDGTGFMLGLVLYAVGLNYLRYGWPGVTGWLKAKFINEPANLHATGPAPFGPPGGGAFNGGPSW